MQKYTRGQSRPVVEGAFAAYDELLMEDSYPTWDGLKHTLDVEALWDPKAAQAKVAHLVDLRFINELKKSGFFERLSRETIWSGPGNKAVKQHNVQEREITSQLPLTASPSFSPVRRSHQ